MAHEIWLRLIASGKQLHELPKARFVLQRGRVLDIDVEVPEGEWYPELVSG